jgi:ATP-dependent RNA helicase MSS116
MTMVPENKSDIQTASEGASSANRKRKQSRRSPPNTKKICRFFQKGSCKKGDDCEFLHEEGKPKEDVVDQSVKKKNGNSKAKAETVDRPKESSDNAEKSTDNTGGKAYITKKRFADLHQVCDESRRALAEVFQYEFMTEVQAQTLPVILDSKHQIDVLAKAKTGTGKTLGFLIPAVEQLLFSMKNNPKSKNSLGCLVISPTRELAYQIAKEGEKLLTFHTNPKLSVACTVGGTNVGKDRSTLKRGVNILVATPGRLLDHLQNSELKLTSQIANLQVLILDEADCLLDMGFRPDIERILKLLQPSQATRQTLLFSATVPKSVAEVATIAVRQKYQYIDTVGDEGEQTHAHVQQEVMVAGKGSEGSGKEQIRAIASILDREIKLSTRANPCKIIVFFTTARLTGFMAELFNTAKGRTSFPNIMEIHSRKSQSVRQKTSERFRDSKENAILFSSDVSARGMDYPGVTFVLQVGLTERAQYIHRLGRTARAGKGGRGALLLAPYESQFMQNKVLSDMPLESGNVPKLDAKLDQFIAGALAEVAANVNLNESAQQAYRAWLGYYNGQLKKVGWNKKELVQEANQWAKDIGLKAQPALQKKTVEKMGLKGVPGLKLE